MKILIVGSGGVGGFFGGRLSMAGNEVTFLARGEHGEAMKNHGLKIRSINGDFALESVLVIDSLDNAGVYDVVILGIKAWQVKSVAKQLVHVLHAESMVITTQNGVMAREELLEFIPERNIIEGTCQIISKIEAPGVISHFGVEPKITVGEQDGQITARLKQLESVFQNADINLQLSNAIRVDVWNKFIMICVGGLVAVSRLNYGAVRSNPESRQLIVEVLTEGYQLAKAVGIPVSSSIIDKCMGFIDSFPVDATSSLCRDIWEGRPSEIDYKNGGIVTIAQRYGLATPVNRFIYYSLLPLEMAAREAQSDK